MTEDELIEEYVKLAQEMNIALVAAKSNILPNILGKAKDMQLEKEDYRQLGTSLFIEKHYASRRSNSKGDYEGEITENQEKFIGILLTEKKDSVDTLAGFLDANDKELVKDLTASEASSLIDTLKSLKKK
ncbi:MAG: hypothetical protein ACTSWQ_03165 [Candidatus Thorarchaeota archaeon]